MILKVSFPRLFILKANIRVCCKYPDNSVKTHSIKCKEHQRSPLSGPKISALLFLFPQQLPDDSFFIRAQMESAVACTFSCTSASMGSISASQSDRSCRTPLKSGG